MHSFFIWILQPIITSYTLHIKLKFVYIKQIDVHSKNAHANTIYHAPHINNQHLNQIGLRSIQCCLQVKSFLIKILFNFSICFVRLTLIDKINSSVINIQHRQDRRDRVRFYIEFTKIGVEILKGKGYAVSIV